MKVDRLRPSDARLNVPRVLEVIPRHGPTISQMTRIFSTRRRPAYRFFVNFSGPGTFTYDLSRVAYVGAVWVRPYYGDELDTELLVEELDLVGGDILEAYGEDAYAAMQYEFSVVTPPGKPLKDGWRVMTVAERPVFRTVPRRDDLSTVPSRQLLDELARRLR